MAIIKLKLRESKEGFQVDLTAKQLDIETEGFLPLLPAQLESSFNNWQLAYRQIDAVRSYIAPAPGMRIIPKAVTKYSSAEHTTSVKNYLNKWLNCGDRRWLPVRDKLIAIAQQLHHNNEDIRIVIDAKDVNLRRLPWQEWSLFEEYYPQVEIALSAAKNRSKNINYAFPQSAKIRVLVAVGRSDGINTKNDLKVIKELEQHGAEVVCLIQPTPKELSNALWDDGGYHIFIFTGHSGSQEDGSIGWIELNERDSLSIEQFKEALKQAINRGLQLAIFNSCDGLGLANQLGELHLPRCIVMREPVPDSVAVEFLKHFFEEFTGDRSLSQALNKARKRLEHFNLDYPGAIWLPIICIASNVKPLTWKSLNQGYVVSKEVDKKTDELKPKKKQNIKPFILTGLISLLMLGGIFGLILPNIWKSKTPEGESDPNKSTFSSVSVPYGTFRHGGSTTWEPLRQTIDSEISNTHPNFELVHQGAIGSGAGIKILLNDRLENGKLDFVLSSRQLKEQEIQSKQDNFQLREEMVARDGIAIAVNPKLQIKGLTIQNLKDIYTGKITNWKEVNGPNLTIFPISRNPEKGGTSEFFVNEFLDDREFGQNIDIVNTTTEALRKVERNIAAIYYASAPEVVPQCNVRTLPIGKISTNFVSLYKKPFISPEKCKEDKKRNKVNQVNVQKLKYHYPRELIRRLYVIYKQKDSIIKDPDIPELEPTKAGKAYVSLLQTSKGKEIIEEAGFALP
jgi:ABC-type phosphate transport system substrate-binding protein